MKKFNPLLKSFIVIVFLTSSLRIQADPIDDYLDGVEREFDSVSPAKRYDIISMPLNLSYLRSLKNGDELDNSQLTSEMGSSSTRTEGEKFTSIYHNQTNPLALAISLGKRNLVSKFLSAVEDVNDEALQTWGYRQIYTLAHVALDPRYPEVSQNVPLKDRLEIIDELAKKGADFNKIIKWGGYKNPPLSAGEPSSFYLEDLFDPVRARALLYGANPSLEGSCFYGVNLEEELDLLSLTLRYYIEKMKVGADLNPTKEVTDCLKSFMLRKKGLNLDAVLEEIAEVRLKKQKLEDNVEFFNSQINTLRNEKTKESERKTTFLQTEIDKLQKDIKALNRKLSSYKY